MAKQGYLMDTKIAIVLIDSEPSILELIKQAAADRQNIYFFVVTECELISCLARRWNPAYSVYLGAVDFWK